MSTAVLLPEPGLREEEVKEEGLCYYHLPILGQGPGAAMEREGHAHGEPFSSWGCVPHSPPTAGKNSGHSVSRGTQQIPWGNWVSPN